MAFQHAVIWLHHFNAHVIEFDPEHMRERHLQPHVNNTRQHRSDVRSEHEFFSQVCDAVAGMASILVTAAHTVQADFRHYIDKHRVLDRMVVTMGTPRHRRRLFLYSAGTLGG